jgi:hypothetical protein
VASSPEYNDDKLLVPEKADNFLTGCATIGFSRRTMLHEINISSNLMEVYIINAYRSASPQEQQSLIFRKLT